MSPALTAVTRRRMVRPRNSRSNLQTGWFLLAAISSLAPVRAFAAVSVTISPSAVNLAPGGTQQFTAIVTGAGDTSVIWTIQEGASGGTVTGSGLFSAPAAVGVYHVVATSNADNTQSATATIALPGFVTWGLNTPREFADATLLPNGKILFTGGVGSCASTSAEVYDPAIDRSTNTTGMLVARCTHSATLLQNGKVLVAGGQSIAGETATAELFDPASGTFTATGSMMSRRGGHTATLLSNGKVLITGGGIAPRLAASTIRRSSMIPTQEPLPLRGVCLWLAADTRRRYFQTETY
jgi:Bacterial Ig-like domain (group 2)